MAQKTPLTALTIDYADRWNGTWFVELSIFRYKLIEDYHLRFLITCFLRIKKQWLYLLSVNHSGGFLFLQMMTCYSNSKVQTKPMLFPTQEGQAYLKDWQQQFENKVNKLTIFQKLNLDLWQKRLSVKKQNMWNYLQNTLLLQTNDNLAAGIFFSRMPQHATLSTWFHNKQVKLSLILLAEHINNVLITAQYNNNSLVAVIQQNFITKINIIKDKMKYLQNLDWLLFLPMLYNIKKSNVTQRQFKKVFVQKRLFSSQQLFALVKLTNNYPLHIYSSHINVQLKEFQVITQQQLSVKKVSVSSYKKKELTAYYFSRKKALYQTIYQSKSYLMRRIFAFKQYSSMKEGFQVFFKRFRLQFALRKTLIMLNTPLIFLAQALKRVTGLRQFFSYLPMKWSHYDYKPVKRYTIFERYGTKKYFVPTFVATHLAMSRGSATVLVDLLVQKLRHEYEHTQFLSCVEKICRHLMAPPKSNTAYENVICKGIEILFTGKVNGSDRSKQWRFKLGPVHSSTFYTNTRLEQAKVITKFGAFNLSVRMKLGSVRYFSYSYSTLLGYLFTYEQFVKPIMHYNCFSVCISQYKLILGYILLQYPMFLVYILQCKSTYFALLNDSLPFFFKKAYCDPLDPTKQEIKNVASHFDLTHSAQQKLLLVENDKLKFELARSEEMRSKLAAKLNILQQGTFSAAATLEKSWVTSTVDECLKELIKLSGQTEPDSATTLALKQVVQNQLTVILTECKAKDIPITRVELRLAAQEILDDVLVNKENQEKTAAYAMQVADIMQKNSSNKVYNSIYDNKSVISGTVAGLTVGYFAQNPIKSAYDGLVNSLSPKFKSYVKSHAKSIVVLGGGAYILYKLGIMESPYKNSSPVTPTSEGMITKAYNKSKSSSSRDYSTVSKRHYSNFSFKEKLEKGLKLIKHKQKFLCISAIILSQIFLLLYFLKEFIHIYFMNWIFFFSIDYTLDEVLLISFLKFRDHLFENPYLLWNFSIGLSSARCFYSAVEGILFFYREKFNPFVLNVDNLWLSAFIDKHKFLKEQWLFLARFPKFNALTLLDQGLIRIILIKVWVYLLPFVLNLMFFKTFYWQWFLIGLSAMWLAQFFFFLAVLFCISVYIFFIKMYNICVLDKFDKNYENNFLQYANIFLTQNLVYNFLLITFWTVVLFFKQQFWLNTIAVIAVLLFVAVIVIGFLLSLIGTLFGFLYFFTLFVFNTHLQNLSQYELFIKKSKVFLHICVLLFFILLFLYFKP
jgi:hypothetical protein